MSNDASYLLPEDVNLAMSQGVSEEILKKIGGRVKDDYENDLESRSEWEDMVADWVRLFYMKDRPINPPWEGASEESIPMLLEACNQSHARAYGEMFSNKNLITCIPTGSTVGPDIRARMDRITAHMSYQLLVKDATYKTDKDRMLLCLPLYGSMFTKTYRDHLGQRNRVETIRPFDLVIPYGTGPRSIEDIPRKSHRIYLPMYNAKYLTSRGYFKECPVAVESNSTSTKPDDEAESIEGMSPSFESKDYALVIEQHCMYDLDKDGLDEPYIITFDGTTGKVLRISIRYETDPRGLPTDYKAPIEYFTDYHFIPNPNGFYGLGYGMLLQGLNTSVNKLLRQTIDAGTLQNAGNMSGFVDRRVGIAGKVIKLALGKFIRTESGLDDLSKGFFQMKFPGPSSVIAEVLRLLTLRGDRLAMVTETITGQAERVMQPTTVLALIEQAQVIFAATHARTLESWTRELQKIYDLNGKYLNEYETFTSMTSADPMTIQISQLDYAPDMKVYPSADPKMSTKRERLALSDAEFQTALQCPFTMADPMLAYNVYRRRFEAIGCKNINEILPPPPQPIIDPMTGQPLIDPMTGRPMMPPMPMMPGQAQPGQEDSGQEGPTPAEGGTQKPVQQQGNMM